MSDLDEEELKATREMKAINKVIAPEEKSADEMFEKLGYEKDLHIDRKEQVWGEYFYNKKLDTLISFDYIDKGLCCSTKSKNAEPIYIEMKELQAINKKCKELGWIE